MSKKFKIPNILRSMRDHKHDEDWDNHFAALEAAPRHAKHLSKAVIQRAENQRVRPSANGQKQPFAFQ